MVLQSAIESLSGIMGHYSWVDELAGILPLSALIDFVEVPPKLHILELASSVPLWSWVITPSGSRLLLADRPGSTSCDCLQDRFGRTIALEALDGRYGDRYFVASPETLRLVLASLPCIEVVNNHENMITPDLRNEILRIINNNGNMTTERMAAQINSVIIDPKFAAAAQLISQIQMVLNVDEKLPKRVLDVINNRGAEELGGEILKMIKLETEVLEELNRYEGNSVEELRVRIHHAMSRSEYVAVEGLRPKLFETIQGNGVGGISQLKTELENAVDLRKLIRHVLARPEPMATGELRTEISNIIAEKVPTGVLRTKLRDIVSCPQYKTPTNLRTQSLEVVHISQSSTMDVPAGSGRHPWHVSRLIHLTTVTSGWILLVCMLIISGLLQTWISLSFHLVVPFTGLVVRTLYGLRPRQLLVDQPSKYIRLIVVAEQMNSAEWTIIYGDSTIINSFINRPLSPVGPSLSPLLTRISRCVLRICIISQWALVLAAAANKNWDAYLISFWVAFSIFSHSYLITPSREAGVWAQQQANLEIKRFCTRVSSRRALLNAIIALNPDTLFHDKTAVTNWKQFNHRGVKWVDPILAPSESRENWENATREAMHDFELERTVYNHQRLNNFLRPQWHNTHHGYWKHFIGEGIYIAAEIRKLGNLPRFNVPEA